LARARWRWRYAVLLVLAAGVAMTALLGVPLVSSDFCEVTFVEQPAGATPRREPPEELLVTTLNMALETSPVRVLQEWDSLPALRDADVIFMQEVVDTGEPGSMIREVARLRELHLLYVSPAKSIAGVTSGLAILSRFPLHNVRWHLLKGFNLRFRTRCRLALAATVDSAAGPARLFNLHLDTRINARERTEQVTPIAETAAQWPGPVIVGGDFNTNHMLWVGRVFPIPFVLDQGEAVRRIMHSHGFTTPIQGRKPTFDVLWLALDWIYLKNAGASVWGVQPIHFSDHHAVWMRVRLQRVPTPVGSAPGSSSHSTQGP
jgi:endonuclease/exonuclease/phosphatase family metal-dependent hydrolase